MGGGTWGLGLEHAVSCFQLSPGFVSLEAADRAGFQSSGIPEHSVLNEGSLPLELSLGDQHRTLAVANRAFHSQVSRLDLDCTPHPEEAPLPLEQ